MSSPPRHYPTDLSDAEWTLLAPLIPPAKPGGRPPKWTRRELLDGIFSVVRSGCQWRLLPREFPPWQTVYHSFRLRRLDGTWQELNATLRDQERVRQGQPVGPDDRSRRHPGLRRRQEVQWPQAASAGRYHRLPQTSEAMSSIMLKRLAAS